MWMGATATSHHYVTSVTHRLVGSFDLRSAVDLKLPCKLTTEYY